MYPPGVVIDVTFDELLVLIVREAALRGLLIGQLSLAGEVLVTYDGPLDDTAFDRTARPPAILITDDEAVAAFQLLCKLEGIIPALESAHALAHVLKLAPTLPKDNLLVMNLSGRGDKDVAQIAARLGMKV